MVIIAAKDSSRSRRRDSRNLPVIGELPAGRQRNSGENNAGRLTRQTCAGQIDGSRIAAIWVKGQCNSTELTCLNRKILRVNDYGKIKRDNHGHHRVPDAY